MHPQREPLRANRAVWLTMSAIEAVFLIGAPPLGEREELAGELFGPSRRLEDGVVAMYGGEVDTSPRHAADGGSHGIGHVEELEVHENAFVVGNEPVHELPIAAGHEELEAQLRGLLHSSERRAQLGARALAAWQEGKGAVHRYTHVVKEALRKENSSHG